MRYRLVIVALLAIGLGALASAAVPGFAGLAQAQAVGRILVEGNQRVEAETVLSYMQIAAGDPYDPERVDQSVKALFQTGLFADVRVIRRGPDLIVQVEENPLINRVNFEGNSEIKDSDLAKETELRERMVFTRARAQNDVQRIVALYRRSGFYSVRIEPKLIRLAQNRVDLVYEIQEGAATKVAAINFVGNEAFSDGDLRGVITTTESAWWRFFSKSDNYDPDRLAYDRELLRRHYLKNGFADVKIVSATAELAPDGESFYITFTLDEGPLYRIGDVAVNRGETALDPERLQGAVVSSPGEDFDESKVDKTVENLTVEAGNQGFVFAKVQPDLQRDPANRTLNIVYNIAEGPRAYIERIDIVGNERTLDEVIRRELRLFEGDAYNRVLVDRARRRLTALDYFEKIDFREEQGSAPDRVVLIVEVVEKSTGSLSFSAGYSTTESIVGGVSVVERNLLGRGQTVRADVQGSFERQSVNLSFTEPYFLDMPVAAGFDLFATQTDNTDTSSYASEQLGGALRTNFRLDEDQSVGLKYLLSRRDVTDINEDASLAIRDAEGVTWKSALAASYTYDNLDNPLNPTKGFRARLVNEVAGLGGDVYYLSNEVSAYYFYPVIGDGVILKLEGNAGNMFSLNGDDVPIIDRFFKGADSLRGFMRSGIGPRQTNPATGNDDAIGGQTYAIGTVEVTFPLGLPEAFGLTGAVFSDFGTLFDAPENTDTTSAGCTRAKPCTVFDTAELRASVGAGVIWQSPFGPLRFDLAYPFLKASYDETEWFRFSVGTRF